MGASSGDLLFLAGDFLPGIGGIQRHAYELVRAVVRRGVGCEVIAPRRGGAQAVDATLGCPVRRVGGRGKVGLALAMATAIRSAARQGTPKVVVATKWMPEGPAYLLAGGPRLAPLALVGHGREFLPDPPGVHWAGKPGRGWLQRRVLGAASWCLAVSSYTAANFRAAGVPDDKVSIIYGGVDVDALQVPPTAAAAARERWGLSDLPLLLTVSRLVRRKGHDLVLRALAAAGPETAEVRYAIVGDGPEERRLRALTAELGLAERVIFAGRVPEHELRMWYAACDVFVMPSRDVPGEPPEGLGLVYLEANAAGRPVIGARTGGTAEAVVDGETGLLVDPEDVSGLARAIVRLLGDRDEAQRLGERGRERAIREFTWEAVADRFLSALGLA